MTDELRTGLARGEIYYLKTVCERYCKFLKDFDLEPGLYKSCNFKTKVEKLLKGKALFVQPLSPTDPLMIFPEMTAEAAFQNLRKTMEDEQESQDDTEGMNMASCDNEILSWLYWVSLKIKADIRESPIHDFIGGIDQHHAEEVVPESLYLLLRLLCTDDGDQGNMDEQTLNTKLLSIAQDIVFLASGGRRPTPKHIGIGVAVHQATRSKGLVQLLHAAGHSISYESVLRTDTAIANEAVKQYFDNGRVFIPQNFVNVKLPGYIMYANDNIDINEETLDGKGTFHASQTAAFRRSEPQEEIPKVKLKSGRAKSLSIPSGMFELKDAKMESQKPPPKFHGPVTPEMYDADTQLTKQSKNQDLAWILSRQQNPEVVPSWSGFSHLISKSDRQKTVAGMMPIINSPAHDYDTIWTVLQNDNTTGPKLHSHNL